MPDLFAYGLLEKREINYFIQTLLFWCTVLQQPKLAA